jgi:hypothetical protein
MTEMSNAHFSKVKDTNAAGTSSSEGLVPSAAVQPVPVPRYEPTASLPTRSTSPLSAHSFLSRIEKAEYYGMRDEHCPTTHDPRVAHLSHRAPDTAASPHPYLI